MPLPESVTVTATHGPAAPPGGAAVSAGHDLGADAQDAAVRHRVAGVDAQVHQHLIELRRIAFDERRLAVVRQLEGDPFGQDAMQQRRQAAQAIAEVDGLQRQRVRAADGEELPRQQRAALGGAGDRAQLLADQRIPRSRRGQAGAGQDDGQQVGEVVRDAAGEQAEALELLGAVEARSRSRASRVRRRGAARRSGCAPRRPRSGCTSTTRYSICCDAGDADAFVAEGAAAERAEGLVEQAQRDADDRAVAAAARRCALLVRGSVRASSTTTGPSAAKISCIIGSPSTGIRGATSQTRSWREPL